MAQRAMSYSTQADVATIATKVTVGSIELSQRRKGDPGKLRAALRLGQETTMTLAWIAYRLQMWTKTHLSHLLFWHGRQKAKKS